MWWKLPTQVLFQTMVHVRRGLECRKGHALNAINIQSAECSLSFQLYIIFFWKLLFFLNNVGLDFQSVSNLSFCLSFEISSFSEWLEKRIVSLPESKKWLPIKGFSLKSIKNLWEEWLFFSPHKRVLKLKWNACFIYPRLPLSLSHPLTLNWVLWFSVSSLTTFFQVLIWYPQHRIQKAGNFYYVLHVL